MPLSENILAVGLIVKSFDVKSKIVFEINRNEFSIREGVCKSNFPDVLLIESTRNCVNWLPLIF